MAKETYTYKASLEENAIIERNAEAAHMSRSSFVVFTAINNNNNDKYLKRQIVKTSCYLRTEINKIELDNPGINLSGIKKGVEELWRTVK